ncbi:MAG: hypothetical protein AABZ64_08395 [Nitrospinota bacterium]
MPIRLAALLLALAILAGPRPAWSAEAGKGIPGHSDEGAMLVDLLLVRPLGLVGVVGGLVLYLPAALLQGIGGHSVEPVAEALVRKPIEFIFKRPLGEFRLD